MCYIFACSLGILALYHSCDDYLQWSLLKIAPLLQRLFRSPYVDAFQRTIRALANRSLVMTGVALRRAMCSSFLIKIF